MLSSSSSRLDPLIFQNMDYAFPYIIDTSTPESLERDFYAWLNVSFSQED